MFSCASTLLQPVESEFSLAPVEFIFDVAYITVFPFPVTLIVLEFCTV